jgi:hypothetical protein
LEGLVIPVSFHIFIVHNALLFKEFIFPAAVFQDGLWDKGENCTISSMILHVQH